MTSFGKASLNFYKALAKAVKILISNSNFGCFNDIIYSMMISFNIFMLFCFYPGL